jgi:glutamate formiminotransferase/formiminotetrahydrofolate cyclodeaminase
MKLFECVPNFSEGRDPARIAAIANAGRGIAGVTLLDIESNPDHNRCVISLVGEADPLLEAVIGMMRVAVSTIDLNHHKGEHPRMGAVDVVPFVPLGEATMPEAIRLAERLAQRVWTELQLPVYLYGQVARRAERADLAVVRRGEFEGIRDSIATDPARAPDLGNAAVHPTAGIVAIGARPILIAYNAYLSTSDVAIAKKVAKSVRARDGGLAEVKALGFDIEERKQAQVSMNLTDHRRTPIHRALELVRREAQRYGVQVTDSEIVGLVPEDALFDSAEYYLQLNQFDRATILERKVRAAVTTGSSVGPGPGGFADRTIREFSDQVAARTPTPGGGSVAGVTAALGAALGEMVLSYSQPAGATVEIGHGLRARLSEARARLFELADADSKAYDEVGAARRSLKERPDDPARKEAWRVALERAAEVPLSTASMAQELIGALSEVRSQTKPALESDLVSALALLAAARDSALANVAINVPDLKAAGGATERFEHALARLRSGGAP